MLWNSQPLFWRLLDFASGSRPYQPVAIDYACIKKYPFGLVQNWVALSLPRSSIGEKTVPYAYLPH